MGKRNKKHKKNAKVVANQDDTCSVSKQDYDRFIVFCKIKDHLMNLIDDLEEEWNDHCLFLVQELQVDYPVVNCGIDDNIGKIKEALRTFKYNQKDKKPKKKKWHVPLSGGITSEIPPWSCLPDKDVINLIKKKKIQKSEVVLEHIGRENGKPPLSFDTSITFPDDVEEKTLQQIIEEVEDYTRRDSSICEHGNRHPCPLCESERYHYLD